MGARAALSRLNEKVARIKVPSYRRIASLLRARTRGQAMVLVAMLVGTGVLLGFVALAVDGGSALLQRRNMQKAADAASLGAAKLLADNVVWGPDPIRPAIGGNGPIYLVTDGQLA